MIPKKPQPTKVEKAQAAGLHPNDRVERATKKLGEDLNQLNNTPTREEFDRLEQRIGLQGRQISYLAQIPVFGRFIRDQLQRAAADDRAVRVLEADRTRRNRLGIQ
ncbi:hypothetical protein AB0P19_07055 [Microbacterium oleivorans]|uniref:hypothetical protein n=1 Tax=Microbacterium oleivorans TaxID=273677 RepID=UPI0033F7F571